MEELFHELQARDFGELGHTALNWDHVREMQRRRISFGVHTVTHPILSRVSLAQARQEIVESKKQIEEQRAAR